MTRKELKTIQLRRLQRFLADLEVLFVAGKMRQKVCDRCGAFFETGITLVEGFETETVCGECGKFHKLTP